MKKIFSILILGSIFSTPSYPAPNSDDKQNYTNQIIINNTMNELIEFGYKLITQETRGIITVYVLKKEDDFAGCRVERSIKKEVEKCYIIELVNNQNK